MDFHQTLAHLNGWAGRQVSAAVRTPGGEAAQVAVLSGRLGHVQRDGLDWTVFFPMQVKGDGTGLDGALGLHFDQSGFQDARTEADRLYMRLNGAMVEVAPQ